MFHSLCFFVNIYVWCCIQIQVTPAIETYSSGVLAPPQNHISNSHSTWNSRCSLSFLLLLLLNPYPVIPPLRNYEPHKKTKLRVSHMNPTSWSVWDSQFCIFCNSFLKLTIKHVWMLPCTDIQLNMNFWQWATTHPILLSYVCCTTTRTQLHAVWFHSSVTYSNYSITRLTN